MPVLIRLLNREKMRPTDVKITQFSNRQITGALRNGRADAIIELRHLTSALVRSGQARVAITNAQINKSIGRIGTAPLVGNASFTKEYKGHDAAIHQWMDQVASLHSGQPTRRRYTCSGSTSTGRESKLIRSWQTPGCALFDTIAIPGRNQI